MILYIAAGSALGGVARYLIGGLVQRPMGTTFPVGTLLVNITGSLLLGAIVRYSMDAPALTAEARAFLTVGLCGGYTTFSTYAYETAALLERGEWTRAGLYAAASVLLSLLAMFLGFAVARSSLNPSA